MWEPIERSQSETLLMPVPVPGLQRLSLIRLSRTKHGEMAVLSLRVVGLLTVREPHRFLLASPRPIPGSPGRGYRPKSRAEVQCIWRFEFRTVVAIKLAGTLSRAEDMTVVFVCEHYPAILWPVSWVFGLLSRGRSRAYHRTRHRLNPLGPMDRLAQPGDGS